MASCSLGVPKIKISAVDLSRVRSGSLLIPYNQRSFIGQKPVKYSSLRTSCVSVKAVQVSTVPAAETSAIIEVEDSEETKPPVLNAELVPKPFEVEALISEICDTSSIAEFELKLGGFRLYVARDLADKSSPQPQPIPPVVAANATTGNGSASSTSLAIAKPAAETSAADQGLMILKAPCVGIFRRSRIIEGGIGPACCKEKDQVKVGRVLCFIDQHGTLAPVKSEVAGEIVKFLKDDGEPVGYLDDLIAILPSFPGIKKLLP